MTSTLPIQEQVDRFTASLVLDVVRIWRDWSNDRPVYFRVILSDAASRRGRVREVTRAVTERLDKELGFSKSDYIPYVNFRSEGEQAQLRVLAWANLLGKQW